MSTEAGEVFQATLNKHVVSMFGEGLGSSEGGMYVDEADVLGPSDSQDCDELPGPSSRISASPSTSQAALLPPIKGGGGSGKQSKPSAAAYTLACYSTPNAANCLQHPADLALPVPRHHGQPSPKRSGASASSASPYSQQLGNQQPRPKPKPKARHDLVGIDPAYLETASYRDVKGVGKVYNWQAQHEVNSHLTKQRQQQERTERVLEAARRQIQAREVNDQAFQLWLDSKRQEKKQQNLERQKVLYVHRLYDQLTKDNPHDLRTKETLWCENFGSKYDAGLMKGGWEARSAGNKFHLKGLL